MHTSLFIYVVSALNFLHVKGISIVDTPSPVENQFLKYKPGGHGSKELISTNQVPSLKATHLENVGNGQNIVDPIRVRESSIFTLGSVDCLENMMRAHTQLYSDSKSEAQQALKTIRLQLFDQIDSDRKWRSGGSTAIMNLKALELLLLKINAKEKANQSLNQLERYLLESTLDIVYNLRSFSEIPAERIWFNRHIKRFFAESNSMFLRDEYSKAVRRAQVNQTPFDIAKYDRTRTIRIPSASHMLSPLSWFFAAPWRIEESQVISRDTPQEIVDFVTLFNTREAETNISDFDPIVERLSQALERPPARDPDPQVNSLRVELIALATRSFAFENTGKIHEEWVSPFFTHLMRLSKLASEPEDRIHAEELVRSLQLAVPSLKSQFVQQYPAILKEIIERDFRYNGIGSAFERVLSNGPDKELRRTALELRYVFERMQKFELNGNVVAPRAVNLKLDRIPGHPLAFLKKAPFPHFFPRTGGTWTSETQMINKVQPTSKLARSSISVQMIEKEAKNWTRLTDDLKQKFLLSSGASASSKMIAEELLFAGGLLALKKCKTLPIPKGGFESIYKTSLTTMKNLRNDHIHHSSQNPKNTLFSSLANKFSNLIGNTS